MFGIITRGNWEQKSAKAVASFMSHPVEVRSTGEQWTTELENVVRWGCTANVPTKNVINKASAIHRAANKSQFRSYLREHAPQHIPNSWFEFDNLTLALDLVNHFPVVVRPSYHEKGKEFYVCSNIAELYTAIPKCGEGYYVSKFEKKAKEYRALVIQGRIVFLVEKKPENTSLNTWGLADIWKTVKWSEWPIPIIRQSIEVALISELDMCAVDIIENTDGQSFICEVNSAPELGGNYWAERIANCLDWIIDNGKQTIEVDWESADNWKHYLHPALSDKVVYTKAENNV